MKNISILGSTGSIGVNTLEVVKANPDKFSVVGLTAGQNIELLKKQAAQFSPRYVSVIHKDDAEKVERALEGSGTEVYYGVDGLLKVATSEDIHMVVSAIVGAAGLIPTISALREGKDVALANKETMVLAGSLIKREGYGGRAIIPVDSEHSAIFQSLKGEPKRHIRKIILTASGGPFRNYTVDKLKKVAPKDALRHPNWSMGKKITIDSATMMNKGLEVIEAKWLFGIDESRIEVLIHPQSIIHSMVEFVDGSVIAQLGPPDMRLPISYALNYPDRMPFETNRLSLADIGTLTFHKPDTDTFPCLNHAFWAMKAGGTMPTVLNAANEIAVEAFLNQKISFLEIPELIKKTMDAHRNKEIEGLADILRTDKWARAWARRQV